MREKAKIKLAVGKSVQERAQDARAKLYMSLGILRKGILQLLTWEQVTVRWAVIGGLESQGYVRGGL